MNIRILPAAFLLCALVLGLTAGILFMQETSFVRNARRTTARVTAIAPLGNRGRLVPVIAFTDLDGRRVERSVRGFGIWDLAQGDAVEILYAKKKVFGLELWNVMIMRDPHAKPYQIYRVIAILLSLLAAGFAVAGVLILMRG